MFKELLFITKSDAIFTEFSRINLNVNIPQLNLGNNTAYVVHNYKLSGKCSNLSVESTTKLYSTCLLFVQIVFPFIPFRKLTLFY